VDKRTPNSLVFTSTQRLADQLSGQYPDTRILRLSPWLLGMCKTHAKSYTLLSESQEHALWQLIISNDIPYHDFKQQAQIAHIVQQAWHLLTQWNISLSHPAFGNTSDTRLFKKWASEFIRRCKQHRWLDASSAIELYIADIQEVPTHITLAGFTELTPQQQRLLSALSLKGCEYEFLKNTRHNTPKKIALDNPEIELTTMARWASHYIEQHPQQNIACIVPQLADNHLFTEEIFLKINPELRINISATQALDQSPLIRSALSKLQEQVSGDRRSPLQWVANFAPHLQTEQWSDVLTEFATLDLVLPELSCAEAIAQLQILIGTTLVRSKETSGRIHILTPTETIGLAFDAVWLMGIQDATWPPAPRPNAFLPIALQRELKMPYASAEQTLDFYRTLTTQLCSHNPTTIISYAVRDNETILRPSPLIASVAEITIAELDLPIYINAAQRLFDSAQLNKPAVIPLDEWAPPTTADEIAHSGSSLFKNQAACPFRAFAVHRLKADALPKTQIGLSAAERGTLIHKILEILWLKLQDHTTLCDMPDSDLKILITKTIQQSLAQLALKPRFKKLELQRLETLFWQWLTLEKKREFFKITAVEKKQTLQLGKYPINLRIDRIDQLADESYFIIDYKTGECSESGWYGDRPDEPQIPLYCVASETPPTSAAFAQVAPGKLGFKKAKSVSHWPTQISIWQTVLKKLVLQFESGYAKVDPKDPPQTCQYCHLAMVCRVKELPLETTL
jgi:hypothetical protein